MQRWVMGFWNCVGWLWYSSGSFCSSGISFKTQLLYSVVFVTRYLDIFAESSFYRFVMKLFFIGSSIYVLYMMRIKFRWAIDHCRIEVLYWQFLLTWLAILTDQRTILLLTLSVWNIFWDQLLCLHSSFTIGIALTHFWRLFEKFFGHFPSIWKLLPFYLNCLCFKGQERRKQLRLITSLLWAPTELCTFPIGSTGKYRPHCNCAQYRPDSWSPGTTFFAPLQVFQR